VCSSVIIIITCKRLQPDSIRDSISNPSRRLTIPFEQKFPIRRSLHSSIIAIMITVGMSRSGIAPNLKNLKQALNRKLGLQYTYR